jgi:hypothetical protein
MIYCIGILLQKVWILILDCVSCCLNPRICHLVCVCVCVFVRVHVCVESGNLTDARKLMRWKRIHHSLQTLGRLTAVTRTRKRARARTRTHSKFPINFFANYLSCVILLSIYFHLPCSMFCILCWQLVIEICNLEKQLSFKKLSS